MLVYAWLPKKIGTTLKGQRISKLKKKLPDEEGERGFVVGEIGRNREGFSGFKT